MIKLKIHPLFYLLLAMAGLTGQILEFSLIFVSVLIHEVAHVLTAFGFGYRTAVIELFPFGGVAKLDYALFNDPVVEGVTALAGPLQSMILAILSSLFSQVFGGSLLGQKMCQINLGLAFFNLLPLFPLDGGRMLRVLVSQGLGIGLSRATKRVALLTKITTILLAPFSIYLVCLKRVPLHLPVMLFFLFIAAKEENFFYAYWRQKQKKQTEYEESGVSPAKIWLVKGETRISDLLPFLVGKEYHLFLAENKDGKIIGLVKEEDLLPLLSADPEATVLSSPRQAGKRNRVEYSWQK